MSDAIAEAQALDESATLEQLNNAINGILIAYDALYYYPLQEGFYYIESVAFPGYVLKGDASKANRDGLTAVTLEEADTPPYFKLTRKNGGWLVQSVEDGMYIGTVIGSGSTGKPISLTEDAQYEQVITWISGGCFKIQGSATYPYAFTGSRVRAYNYASGSSLEKRQMWHLHPAPTGMFSMNYNLENGRVQGFVHDFEYTQSDASKISTYNQSPPERRDWPLPVQVFWTRDTSAEAQYITWSESPDFAEAETHEVPSDAASYEIYNLIPERRYYCKVTASGLETEGEGQEQEVLANFTFNTAGQMRHLKVEGTANVRDLGGWPTASGLRVKYGKIFRGAEWNGGHNLEPQGIQELRQAGIKAELDLRSDSEAKSITRSVLGTDITYKRTPLGQTQSHMEGLTNSKDTYKAALQFVFTQVRTGKPVYFHCAIGRDRTGTLAFLLEGLLGMSKSDIYKDYELTNFSYFNTPCNKTQLDPMFQAVEAVEGETLEDKFRQYVKSYFGITNATINTFRDKMLEVPEDPTSIQTTDNGQRATEGAVYDLSGRKINGQSSINGQLPKGVYIVNGRTVLVI